ncbi:hypothetical protein LXM25_28770, partial [Dyadobacter sp. LJ53]|nr:hypothetical protein [Dyadobacter chenwenxiniae]
AIRFDNKFRDYYRRKVDEGKNKMSVLNAVRNKIVHTIFALIKTKQPIKITWFYHRNQADKKGGSVTRKAVKKGFCQTTNCLKQNRMISKNH